MARPLFSFNDTRLRARGRGIIEFASVVQNGPYPQ